MEAAIFDLVSQAFSRGQRQAILPLPESSILQQLIWVVWDHIVGPEVRFAWVIGQEEGDGTPEPQPRPPPEGTPQIGEGDPELPPTRSVLVEVHRCPVCGSQTCPGDCPQTPTTSGGEPPPPTTQLSIDCSLPPAEECAGFGQERTRADSTLCDLSGILRLLSSEIGRGRDFGGSQVGVDFKLALSSDRGTLTLMFIFSAKHKGSFGGLQALAYVTEEGNLPWVLKMQPFIRMYTMHILSRLKVWVHMCEVEESICGLSGDWLGLCQVLTSLQHRSLATHPPRYADSLFARPKLQHDHFLASTIAALWRSQGYVVIVGSDYRSVNSLVQTLALCLPESDWIRCRYAPPTSPNSLTPGYTYCPFLKIQTLPLDQLRYLWQDDLVFKSPWPPAIINLDSKEIHLDPSPAKFWANAKLAVRGRVEAMLDPEKTRGRKGGARGVSVAWKKYRVPKKGGAVWQMLLHLDLLPYELDVRRGYLVQFQRFLAHKSAALTAYVDAERGSKSGPNLERESKSGPNFIAQCQSAVDLDDADWWAVVATADRISPGFARYITQLM